MYPQSRSLWGGSFCGARELWYNQLRMTENGIRRRVAAFIKKESVLCIAFVCALVSLFVADWTPGDLNGYIKWKTLCVLASLMMVVAGFKENGVFDQAAANLTRSSRRSTGFNGANFLVLSLVLLPFFAAMIITNDVALLTFVPLGLYTLERVNMSNLAIRVTILQAIAANLGSMLTPFGNPHNLECFIHYDIPVKDFFGTTLMFFILSLALLTLASIIVAHNAVGDAIVYEVGSSSMKAAGGEHEPVKTLNIVYSILALIALLTVFNVIPWYAVSMTVIALVVLIVDRKLYAKVDWCLLLTFVCFFIFSGNLSSIDAVRDSIEKLTEKNTFITGALTSQVISNVPATILLEPFTNDWRALMIGTDVGGLGTPIASMANLIAIKAYMKQKDSKPGRFMAEFLIIEFVFFAIYVGYSGLIGLY